MTNESNFRIIYRWKVKEGHEEQFKKRWEEVTKDIKSNYGGLGSCLHKANDGTYVAYAQWPTKKHWEKMKEDRKDKPPNPLATLVHDPIELDVLVDYLIH